VNFKKNTIFPKVFAGFDRATDFLQKELEQLEKRRTYEFDTVKEIFENSDSSAPQYFISIKWFKEWRNFVDGVNKGNPALCCIKHLTTILLMKSKCYALNNKLSLVGMKLPEKYEENFDISSEGLCYALMGLFFHLTDPPGPINNLRMGLQRKRGKRRTMPWFIKYPILETDISNRFY
jgi:hypothetical protein